MKNFLILILCLFIFNCRNEIHKVESKPLTADDIINKSIGVSGGERLKNSAIKFNFRDKNYSAKRYKGKFQLERIFKDSIFQIRDVLSNEGFKRYIDDEIFEVSDEKAKAYIASVNSVHYFSVLPHGLKDKAVNKKLVGEEQIKNKDYFKIRVTFNPNGGGEDYEDVFIYWINKETYKPDYLAYSYNEDDDVGIRFREAYNERYVNGLRFVDYNNYKRKNAKIKLEDLAKAFDANQLELLSEIELKNVEVQLINL